MDTPGTLTLMYEKSTKGFHVYHNAMEGVSFYAPKSVIFTVCEAMPAPRPLPPPKFIKVVITIPPEV